jgi:nucleoside-diphosphate-sugar epimerase
MNCTAVPHRPDKVFVTGAGGFIGRALLQRYRALGCEVAGMDLRPDPGRNIVAGDLRAPELWAEHARGCDLFINAAAVVSLAADWQVYRDVSVAGVRNALDVAIAGGASRFLHYSSIAAMGYDYPAGADERTPTVIGERYRYGVAKAASEHLVLAAHAAGEIDCTIVRPGDVYGPGSRAWLIEPLRMARAGTLILPDGGNGVFTPVYIDDLLDGTLLAAGLPQAAGHIFILWGGEAVSCRQFFEHHWRWAGRQGSPRSLPLGLALALSHGLWRLSRLRGQQNEACPDGILMLARKGSFNGEKAARMLGFSPRVGLQEGMRRAEEWLRQTGEIT